MNIMWLDEAACQDVSSVGGKVANLSRLAADYRVPPGFCLTTAAFREWASYGDADSDDFPPDLLRQLEESYGEMGRRSNVEAPSVAVRSSAIDEDGRFASFAGQYETYLNLVGERAVADGVMRCWLSTRAERVAEYRARYGLSTEEIEMAVLVQQLVPADSSAVIFSANPVTHSRDEVVINASWGLGESIVGGTVSPDTFVISKSDLSIKESNVSEKQLMTVSVPGGSKEVPVPRFMRSEPTLSEQQLIAMAQLAIALEESMGWPVDIESAYHGDELYLLQCRLITTLIEPDDA
jgi:pyruvate,water dikinase